MLTRIAVIVCSALSISYSAVVHGPIKFPKDYTFNEECALIDGTDGKCVNIRNCSTLESISGQIKTCYFERFDEFICCPYANVEKWSRNDAGSEEDEEEMEDSNETHKPYDKVCQKYYAKAKKPLVAADGTVARGILYGNYTLFDEFPFMVAIGWESSDAYIGKYEYKCGGVLIAPDFVLTAAHCAAHGTPAVVLPGGVDLIDTSIEPHPIETLFIHPDYNESEIYNDVALLKLQKPITKHPPACLWDYELVDFLNVTVIGYGHTQFRGVRSVRLLKASLAIIPSNECHEYFRLSPKAYQGILHTQVCAKDPTKLQATCQGDSGGPLIYYDTTGGVRRPYIVGITSQGVGCTNYFPGVYTRVALYLDWIDGIVWKKDKQM